MSQEVLINLHEFKSCACLPQILDLRNLCKVSAAKFMLQQLRFLHSVMFSYSWAFVVMNEVLLCLERWEMAEDSTVAEHLHPFNIWPFNVPQFSQNSRTTQLLVAHRFMRTLQLCIDVIGGSAILLWKRTSTSNAKLEAQSQHCSSGERCHLGDAHPCAVQWNAGATKFSNCDSRRIKRK